MNELNAAIRDIPLPDRLKHRPISERGFPVPWFVSWINGQWDFVNVDPRKILAAYLNNICFICGGKLSERKAYVIGPMCSITRVSVEPACCRACCEYAVRACPFLSRPAMRRNDKAKIGEAEDVPGIMVEHNPGAQAVWVTKRVAYKEGLFHLGKPVEVAWYAEGRRATRAEVEAAIAKGLPILRAQAEAGGPDDVAELNRYIKRAEKFLP